MWLNKNKVLIIVLFKNFVMILGLNIFLTSVFIAMKLEFKKNNLESEMKINIKKFKYDQKAQIWSKCSIWLEYLLITFSEVSSIDH